MIFHFNKSKLEKDKISFKAPFYYTDGTYIHTYFIQETKLTSSNTAFICSVWN